MSWIRYNALYQHAAINAYSLTASVGTFTLSGQVAGLKAARKTIAAVGTFALSGKSVGLFEGRKLAADAGTFILTGQAAGLVAARRMAAGVGTFALTGIAAGLLATHVLAAGPGAFTFTGQDVNLHKTGSYTMTAAAGGYALTGKNAGLYVARTLRADVGTFAYVGKNVGLFGPPPSFTSLPILVDLPVVDFFPTLAPLEFFPDILPAEFFPSVIASSDMIKTWPAHRVDDDRPYGLTWKKFLQKLGDTIASSEWEFPTDDGAPVNADGEDDMDEAAYTTQVRITGGTPGVAYVILNHVTTAAGYVHTCRCNLIVED